MRRTVDPILTRPSRRSPRARSPRRLPDALRLGLLLRRHPRLWWCCVAGLALAVGASVAAVVGRAEDARADWGAARPVVVVQRDLTAGHRLQASDLALEQRPVAVTPPDALEEVPEGVTLRADAYAGEVLVIGRLAGKGLSPLAAALPAGTRAVAIPVEPGTAPTLQPGDRVDVLVALAPDAAAQGPSGFVLAHDAEVVAVDERAVSVAVEPEVAPKVAVALGSGAVTLALVGG